MRRLAPVTLITIGVLALLVWYVIYTRSVVRELRQEASRVRLLSARVYNGLSDPNPHAANAALRRARAGLGWDGSRGGAAVGHSPLQHQRLGRAVARNRPGSDEGRGDRSHGGRSRRTGARRPSGRADRQAAATGISRSR